MTCRHLTAVPQQIELIGDRQLREGAQLLTGQSDQFPAKTVAKIDSGRPVEPWINGGAVAARIDIDQPFRLRADEPLQPRAIGEADQRWVETVRSIGRVAVACRPPWRRSASGCPSS